jgi:RNA polymerase primary sigma factor
MDMIDIPQSINEIPLEDVVEIRATSVRLAHAIRAAKTNGKLPFRTIGDYIDAGTRGMDSILKICNLGRKSAKEFHDIIHELALNWDKAAVNQNMEMENHGVNMALLAPKVSLAEFVNKNPVSVRLRNAINEACIAGKNPFQTVADYLNAGINGKNILLKFPNLGKKSIDELDNAIEQSINTDCLKRAQADQYNLEPSEVVGNYFLLALQVLNEGLSEKQLVILKDRLVYHRTLEQIAGDYDVTRERVRQIEKSSLRNLGQLLNGFAIEIETSLSEILGAANFSTSIESIAKEASCKTEELHFLINAFIETTQGVEKKFGIKDSHIYYKPEFSPETAWEDLVFDTVHSVHWPIPMADLYSSLISVPVFFITSYLLNSLDAVIQNDQLLRLESLRSTTMCIKVLRQEKRPLHTSEIRARLHELFKKDVDERAIGATLGRLKEALIVDPGTYALYEHLPYTASDLKNIRDSVFSYLTDKSLYVSSKIIFDVLFRRGGYQFPLGFNDYIVLGVVQDDERFVTKRGNMIGLASFKLSETFSSLEDEVHSIIDEHGPISIREVRALLSETRKLCNDSGIRNILDSSSEIICVGKSTYDTLYRFFENRQEYDRLKLAIQLILMQHDKSAYAVSKELNQLGFTSYSLDTLESIIKTTEGVSEESGTYSIDVQEKSLIEYNNLVSHELSKNTDLGRIKDILTYELEDELVREYSSLDLRLLDKGAAINDQSASEVKSILDQFGI